MSEPLMLLKKPSYPLTQSLLNYLERYERISKVSVFYDDLLRFSGSVNVYDKNEDDTLWIRVYYSEFERNEIDLNLKKSTRFYILMEIVRLFSFLILTPLITVLLEIQNHSELRFEISLTIIMSTFILKRQMLPEFTDWN